MRGAAKRTALITGGAGFIGSNLADRLLNERDTNVRVFDNLSRHGVQRNLDWLLSHEDATQRLEIIEGDVRDAQDVKRAVRGVTEIYHLAAQVAVTTSVDDPRTDFSVNAMGTLNVLEAARMLEHKPFVLYTSTNKVYGSLEDVPVQVDGTQYRACLREFKGVNENMRLDFHSPYGCSKGTADQYVRDYARIYGLPTVVFRMSCIAGPRQFGNEDQGWVAHFLYTALAGNPITIYGDGYQVRDVLHVHDLLDAMGAVRGHMSRIKGEIYNVGGGMERVISVLDLLRTIAKRTAQPLRLEYSDVRPGDQPLYVSDTSKLRRDTGWNAQRSLGEILEDIETFWYENREVIEARSGFSLAPDGEMEAQEVA